MKISRIKETCIYVSDLESTRYFYHELLELPVISMVADRHIFFRAGDSVLLCFIAAHTLSQTELPPHGTSGNGHFAFEVVAEDYAGTEAMVRARGIEVVQTYTWPRGHRSFYFHDPSGNLVEFIEAGLWD